MAFEQVECAQERQKRKGNTQRENRGLKRKIKEVERETVTQKDRQTERLIQNDNGKTETSTNKD